MIKKDWVVKDAEKYCNKPRQWFDSNFDEFIRDMEQARQAYSHENLKEVREIIIKQNRDKDLRSDEEILEAIIAHG